jgi:hypothetical protein
VIVPASPDSNTGGQPKAMKTQGKGTRQSMEKMVMDRRGFLGSVSAGGAAWLGMPGAATAQDEQARGSAAPATAALRVRPYQLLCAICAVGAGPTAPRSEPVRRLLEAVHRSPDVPLTIVCNAGDVYAFQDPGVEEDTPEGRDFNRKRDLDILATMSWPPGVTLPARAAFQSLLKHIVAVNEICGCVHPTAEAWRGCPKAKDGNYEKGRALGIDALVTPRPADEMAREKEASLRELNSGKGVSIRPHLLLCAVCQYGGGLRPPFKDDNLPEFLDMILHRNPDVPVTMVRGADCWMMCAPCPRWQAQQRACVNVLGSGGLSNEKRDLDTLQALGLQFGSTMKARDLYRLVFERIPSTQDICKRVGNLSPCVWWDDCGESNAAKGNEGYVKGRNELLAEFARLP